MSKHFLIRLLIGAFSTYGYLSLSILEMNDCSGINWVTSPGRELHYGLS